jgi:integrase
MSTSQYLEKRHNTYFAVVEVPKPLRAQMGKRRFIKSLKTDSLSTANRLKLPLVAEWKRQINRAEQGQPDRLASIRERLIDLQREIDEAPNVTLEGPNGHSINLKDWEISEAKDALKRLAAEAGLDEDEQARARALVFEKDSLLRDLLPLWKPEMDGTVQTKDQHQFAVTEFLRYAGETTTVKETNRKKAGEWIGKLIASEELSRRTIERYASSLSTMWKWMYRRGHWEGDPNANPWLGHGLGKGKKKRKRKPLPEEAVIKLLSTSYAPSGQRRNKRYQQVIPDVMRIAFGSGMRLGEICELERTDVERRDDGLWFNLGEGKTEAAERSVPVHPIIAPIVERYLAMGDQYLIPNLVRGGRDQRRGHHVSKAFGRFRGYASVTEKGQVFHAIRNTFMGYMEGHGVPESTTKLLVGHARESMTYGHYSDGQRVDLRQAMSKLDYGPVVMKLISDGPTFSGKVEEALPN